MQLESFYRVTFTTPESWSVTREGPDGTEGQSFLIAEGRAEGGLSARYRAANFPRRRVDGALEPAFRGVLETDDGASILFHWDGLARLTPSGMRQLVGMLFHVSDDERYRWLNDRVCAIEGEVRPRPSGDGFDVVLDVSLMASTFGEPQAPASESGAWKPDQRRCISQRKRHTRSRVGRATAGLRFGDAPL